MNQRSVFFGLTLVLIGFSCSAPVHKETPPAPPAETSVRSGVVTYVAGDIQIQKGTAWEPLDVGDQVSEDSQVKTGKKSACDIQFAQLGVVHLSEGTTASMKTIGISSKHKAVDVELLVGSVTAKVSKLVGSDRFQVRTTTVVCGVRGTRFVVTTDGRAGSGTKVAVAEGRVALIPPTYDAKKFDDLSATAQGDTMVQAVQAQILEISPSVDIGSEVVVTQASMKKSSDAISQIQEAVLSFSENQKSAAASQTAPATPTAPAALPDVVTKAMQTYQESVPAQPEPTRPLGAESKKVLLETVDLHVLETPPPKKDQAAAPVSVTPAPAPVPVPAVAPVLAAPRLVAPAQGSSVDINQQSSIRFSWKSVPGATGYEVSLFQGQSTTPVKRWSTSGSTVVLDRYTDLQVGPVHWEVVAVKTGDTTLKSVVSDSSFLIVKGSQLAAPALDLPGQGSN